MASGMGAAHGVEEKGVRGGWIVWIPLTAVAQLVAFLLGASWWVWADGLLPEPYGLFLQISMLLFKALAGVPQGMVLGLVQSNLMSRRLPDISIVRWATATCIVAMVGWAAGSTFSIFSTDEGGAGGFDLSFGQTMLMAAGLGLFFGTLFGGVQASTLGDLGVKRWPWIFGNAVGWGLGLPAIYMAASGVAFAPVWALGLIGGLIAGALVGAATAVAFMAMTL